MKKSIGKEQEQEQRRNIKQILRLKKFKVESEKNQISLTPPTNRSSQIGATTFVRIDNRTPHIRHQCRKTTVLSCHR